MLKNSLLVKEFSYEDDKSVDFSVDPHMYEKLNIKKAKKGDENAFDIDKLYDFQLKKDIEKIRTVKGSYKSRNQMYLDIRKSDPYYKAVAQVPQLGKNANFKDLLKHTTEASWRSSSVPYGVIAHKRYLEYLNNLPKGPTEEELLDRLQRKTDNELWDNIQTGKLEPTRKDLRERDKLRAEKAAQAFIEANVIDLHKEERERKQIYRDGAYEKLRKLPTLRQHTQSLHKWHKGIHYPYNLDKGFPIVVHDMKGVVAGSLVMKDRHTWEAFTPAAVYSGDRFTKGEKAGDAEYLKHLSLLSYDKAVRFLKDHKTLMEQQAKQAAEDKEAAERGRRRVGQAMTDIAETLVQVKVAKYQKEHAFTQKMATGEEQDEDSDSSDGSSAVDEEEKEVEDDSPAIHGAAAHSPDGPVGDAGDAGDAHNKAERSVKGAHSRRYLCCFVGNKKYAPVFPAGDSAATPTKATAAFTWQARFGGMVRALYEGGRSAQFFVADRIEDLSGLVFGSDDHDQHTRRNARRKKHNEQAAVRQRLNDLEAQLVALSHPDSYVNRAKGQSELVPREQFYEEVARKKKLFRREMKRLRLANKVMTPEDRRSFAALKIRLDALLQTEEERAALDAIDIHKKERISEFIEQSRNQLEEDEKRRKASRMYKLTHWYSLWRKARKRALLAAQQAEKAEAQKLKPYSKEENQRVVGLLVELRTKEIEAEHHFSRLLGRCTGVEVEDKAVLFTVDDLVLAAQAGKYKLVLDMVLHKTHPVGPNEVNIDGVTATYATLMMLLRNEVLLDDRNLDMLVLSKWQRFRKAHPIFARKKADTAKLEFVLDILLYQGGDVLFATKEQGRDGVTVMHCAAEMGANEMIQWLLAMNVSPNLRTTKLRKTPLMIAAECDKLDTVMLLLKNGAMATIDAVDKFGWTALHYATIQARPELAKVLLICGAKCTLRNAQGRLPQEEATQRGRTELAVSLMTFRSDVVDHLSRLQYLAEDEHAYSYHTVKEQRHNEEGSEEEEEEEKEEEAPLPAHESNTLHQL